MNFLSSLISNANIKIFVVRDAGVPTGTIYNFGFDAFLIAASCRSSNNEDFTIQAIISDAGINWCLNERVNYTPQTAKGYTDFTTEVYGVKITSTQTVEFSTYVRVMYLFQAIGI